MVMYMGTLHSVSFLYFVIAASSILGIGYCQDSYYNVLEFGATGDGNADDSQAFVAAFRKACRTPGTIQTVNFPPGKAFSLKPLTLEGPCKANNLQVQVDGNVAAPATVGEWRGCEAGCLLCFQNVNGLILKGAGLIDGKGSSWWSSKSNLINTTDEEDGCAPPALLHFHKCDNLNLHGIASKDSPRGHVVIHGCTGVRISNIHITAPEDSPNTDGIDIAFSSQLDIRNSFIGTGDDCIAIKGGSSFINISNVACGPGHGISVGSLGEKGAEDRVQQVHVQGCTFTKTQNAARIKTWMGGAGYARSIFFNQITLIESGNPIIIDQKYCDGGNHCPPAAGAVKVSDVSFRGFHGTSAVEQAITLDCSNLGCTNIIMDRVNITSVVPGKPLRALCNNANGKSGFTAPDVPCLAKK